MKTQGRQSDRNQQPSAKDRLRPTMSRRLKRHRWIGVALTVISGAGVVTAAVPSGAATRTVPFIRFSTCPKLTAALRTLTLPYVGPYGLSGPFNIASPPRPGGTKKKVAKSAAPPVPIESRAPSIGVPNTEAAAAPAPAPAAPATAAPAAAAVAVDAAPSFTGPDQSAAANSSATNVQEIGVDEGDTVENDGRYLFSAVLGSLRIIDTTTGTVVAKLGSANGSEQLLLDGNRLAVTRVGFDGQPETVVDLWDVTDRTKPVKLSETHLEGTPLAVRSVGGRARIVLQTQFGQRLDFFQPGGNSADDLLAAQTANQNVVKRANVDKWLPRSYVVQSNGSQTAVRTAIDCREVGRPQRPSGLGFTWVATLDLDVPNARVGARGSAGVIASGQTVYASKKNLYVATSNFQNLQRPKRSAAPVRPTPAVTDISVFDLSSADGATYRSSGSVTGRLLNQFSMSELNGDLRVATTRENAGFGTTTASSVSVLRETTPRQMNLVGELNGLGRTERIYAVRFVGDLGYVVTFRQTDPLYVIDLRQPQSPRLIGELKIPGYSSYLHPIGPGRLIGIGEDATAEGRITGMQLSLFDVSNPSDPKQMAKLKVGGSSAAEYDHRAFLYWAPTSNVIVPSITFDPNEGPKGGVLIANVSETAITEKGRVIHEDLGRYFGGPVPLPAPVAAPDVPVIVAPPGALIPTTIPSGIVPPVVRPTVARRLPDEPISRSLIVNGALVTVSPSGVKSSNLDTLKANWYLKNPS
jgi:hypothetical protein